MSIKNKIVRKTVASITTVSTIAWAAGFLAITPVAAVVIADGDLVKPTSALFTYNASAVYYVSGSTLRVFPHANVYHSWGYPSDWSSVKSVSAADLASYTEGAAMPFRDGSMFRGTASSLHSKDVTAVFLVSENKLRPVKSATVYQDLFNDAAWARVTWVPDDLLSKFNYTLGADVEAATPVNGMLVKETAGTTKYLIADGKKRPFASDAAYSANRYKAGDVVSVSSLASFTDGTSIVAAESALLTPGVGTGVVTPTSAVSLSKASDSPGDFSAPYSAADTVFLKAVVSGSGTITDITAERINLGTDVNIANVKIYKGSVQYGTSQTLNAAHKAVFTGLSIPVVSGDKINIAADVAASGTALAGHIVGFRLTNVKTSGGAAVSGLPIESGAVTISSVTIGSATLYNGSNAPTSDTGVDSDAVDFRFTNVKITAGSTEGLNVKQIVAVKNGTAANTDVKDIKLYNDTKGEAVTTVASLDANGRATFDNLNIAIGKGDSVELSILASLTGSGANRTLAFDLHDGTTYTIRIAGATYGYGITPAFSNFCAAAGTCQTQTINVGTLNVSLSASTPATGNIALGGSQIPLAAFDFRVTGEPIRVTKAVLLLDPTTGKASEVTNITWYDKDGNVWAGPQDGTTTTDSANQDITFTDTMTFPVGTTTLTVKANVATAATAGDTILLTLYDPSSTTYMTVKGVDSGKTVTPATAANVVANTQTVLGPALKVTIGAAPIAGSVVRGIQNFTFAKLHLDASSGGEDVKVTQLITTDSKGTSAAYTDVQNLELWGDPDNTDSTDVVEYLPTTASTATNAATVTFTFKTPLKVSKTKTSTLELRADVKSDAAYGTLAATHGHTFYVTTAGATAVGWTTGNSIGESFSGAGQAQIIRISGALKVEVAADRPAAAQFVAGSTGNSMMKYKLTSSYESIDVTQIPLSITGTVGNIAKVKAYVDGSQIGSTNGYVLDSGGDVTVVLNSGTLIVPKDNYKYFEIKVDLEPKDQLTSGDTLEIGISDESGDDSDWGADGAYAAGSYYITATGRDSGATITKTDIDTVGDGSGNIAASKVMHFFDGVLVVDLGPNTPTGTQTPGTGQEVLHFTLTATGDEITIHDIEFDPSGSAVITGTGAVELKSGTVTYADWASGTAWMAAADLHVNNSVSSTRSAGSDSWDTTLSVAPGSPKTLKVTGDTTGAASTKTFQLTITGATALTSGVMWYDGELGAQNLAACASDAETWNTASSKCVVDSALTQKLPVFGKGLSY